MAGLRGCVGRKVAISIYADDICIWTSGKSRPALQRRLQLALDAIQQYLSLAGLDISTEKTVVLPFTRRNMRPFQLSVAGIPLKRVSHHRFLGLTVDARLSWRRHIASLEIKIHRWIAVIRRLTDHKLQCLLARSLRVFLGVPRAAETRAVIAEARDTPLEVLRYAKVCERLPAEGKRFIQAKYGLDVKFRGRGKLPKTMWGIPLLRDTPSAASQISGGNSGSEFVVGGRSALSKDKSGEQIQRTEIAALDGTGSARSSRLYRVDPELRFQVPPSLPRQAACLLHRLRLNVAYSGRLLYKLAKSPSPNCSEVNVVEATEHVLLRCSKYADSRRTLEISLARLDAQPFNLVKLLGPQPFNHQAAAWKALLRFLEETHLIDIL
ncbi:uncharacterized protein LOC135398393 [Ornithodoros turicata]|uniref:uncharacterized protein LOC135398393 n=1 Tax=Ornithodoros turicata TaxID=34597 RepID=UPI003138DEDF